MKNKTTRFLCSSLIGILVLCIIVFSFLAYSMNMRSRATINEVGDIYMTGMNERISLHFQAVIELRLSQVEEVIEAYPSGDGEDKAFLNGLTYSAEVRGFDHLAFYTETGEFRMVYGDLIQVTDPAPFLHSLKNGEKKVSVGTDVNDNKLVLIGVPFTCMTADNKSSIALVATLPIEYIKDILSLDENDTLVYSHIIRSDGSFVIRSADAFRESYFDRIRQIFKEAGEQNAEKYVKELHKSMEDEKDYSTIMEIGKERCHLYCTKLPYSEWYLVNIMFYGNLDSTVGNLNKQWGYMVFGSCSIVMCALLGVFLGYLKITNQQIRELEEARREAIEANKAKREFLSNMSHDIRTPMNAIVGMTAIATANINNIQQVQNCLRKITLSSKHLLGLINDVLDMSKIESGKMTLNIDQVSLREVMESIVNIVQPQIKSKRQKFEVLIHDISAENVCCDSVRLNQILLNLLSNAIKFTPEGGTIELSLYQEQSPRGTGYVRNHITVKDNGIGMSEEFSKKIFESFSREDRTRVQKTEGTGLGMAITKYIVDAMEGTIEVESQQGKGSTFHLILDWEETEFEEADMILPSWRMLVVDDDQMLCESTVEALKSIGISAEWALDGETALEMVEHRYQEHLNYEIILVDWKLPGIDGIETARRITKRLPGEIPIILISAYDWNDIEEEAREAGISGFISKPLFRSTLFYGLRPYMGVLEEAAESETKNMKKLEGRMILLAEDNELNWEIASELLSELGLKLDWAENGNICVEKFNASLPGYYDAVLMDIRMPVMTGYEAARAIRESDRTDRDIPIIAMTADAFAEDIKKCLDCGMNAHVAKPIDIGEVSRLLEKYIK